MKKLLLMACAISLSMCAESFVKKTGRHRQTNKLSQEEQVRTLSEAIESMAQLGKTIFEAQQKLIADIKEIVEQGQSLYTKESIKVVENNIKTLKICQQQIVKPLPTMIVT